MLKSWMWIAKCPFSQIKILCPAAIALEKSFQIIYCNTPLSFCGTLPLKVKIKNCNTFFEIIICMTHCTHINVQIHAVVYNNNVTVTGRICKIEKLVKMVLSVSGWAPPGRDIYTQVQELRHQIPSFAKWCMNLHLCTSVPKWGTGMYIFTFDSFPKWGASMYISTFVSFPKWGMYIHIYI